MYVHSICPANGVNRAFKLRQGMECLLINTFETSFFFLSLFSTTSNQILVDLFERQKTTKMFECVSSSRWWHLFRNKFDFWNHSKVFISVRFTFFFVEIWPNSLKLTTWKKNFANGKLLPFFLVRFAYCCVLNLYSCLQPIFHRTFFSRFSLATSSLIQGGYFHGKFFDDTCKISFHSPSVLHVFFHFYRFFFIDIKNDSIYYRQRKEK